MPSLVASGGWIICLGRLLGFHLRRIPDVSVDSACRDCRCLSTRPALPLRDVGRPVASERSLAVDMMPTSRPTDGDRKTTSGGVVAQGAVYWWTSVLAPDYGDICGVAGRCAGGG